ncbi:MAG: hypothetical protein PHT45_03970 [Bacteroidales bacterium]|nr:hypothetical protein [Bacteroidales bacterium]
MAASSHFFQRLALLMVVPKYPAWALITFPSLSTHILTTTFP